MATKPIKNYNAITAYNNRIHINIIIRMFFKEWLVLYAPRTVKRNVNNHSKVWKYVLICTESGKSKHQ